jgi:hypothetical protein
MRRFGTADIEAYERQGNGKENLQDHLNVETGNIEINAACQASCRGKRGIRRYRHDDVYRQG